MLNRSKCMLGLSWLLVILASPILFILIVFTLIYRWIVTFILCKIFHPEFIRPVIGLDVGFSLDDFWNKPKGAIAFVYIINGTIDLLKLKKKLNHILFSNQKNYERLMYIYPKIWLSYSFWTKVKEEEFKIENHIRFKQSQQTRISQDIEIKEWLTSPFKFECPLWDILIISEFKQGNQIKSLFGFRIHHVVGDGYSMLQFLQEIFENQEIAEKLLQIPAHIPFIPKWTLHQFNQDLWDKLKLILWIPFIMVQFIHDFFLHQDWFMKPKLSNDIVLVTTYFQLEDLKKIRRKMGSSISLHTIILHIFGGALRKYLVKYYPQETLPAGTIIISSLPHQNHPIGKFCNHWYHATFEIPLNEPNRKKRINILTSNASSNLELKLQKIYSQFSKTFAFLPIFILKKIMNYNLSASMGVSNLVGPNEPVYLNNQKVEKKFAVIGIQWKHASIMVSMFSYNGEMTISMTANQDVIPNEEMGSELLNDFFINELKTEHLD